MKRISGGVVIPKYYIDHFSGITVIPGSMAQVLLSYIPKSVRYMVIQGDWRGADYYILTPIWMLSPRELRIAVRELTYDPTVLAVSKVTIEHVATGTVLPPFNVFYEVSS